MNQHQAEAIAAKLSRAWPAMYCISADTWIEALIPLAVKGAEATAKGLIETSKKAPTVADFLAEYHKLANAYFADKRISESREYDLKAIDHEEYLARLYSRDDAEAVEMQGIWEAIHAKWDMKRMVPR